MGPSLRLRGPTPHQHKDGEDGTSCSSGGSGREDFYGESAPWEVNDAPWRRRFPDVESPYCPSADRSVEQAVTDWLLACPHRLITSSGAGSLIPRSTVTIHRLREVVDAAVDEDLANREAYEQQGSLAHQDPSAHPF